MRRRMLAHHGSTSAGKRWATCTATSGVKLHGNVRGRAAEMGFSVNLPTGFLGGVDFILFLGAGTLGEAQKQPSGLPRHLAASVQHLRAVCVLEQQSASATFQSAAAGAVGDPRRPRSTNAVTIATVSIMACRSRITAREDDYRDRERSSIVSRASVSMVPADGLIW